VLDKITSVIDGISTVITFDPQDAQHPIWLEYPFEAKLQKWSSEGCLLRNDNIIINSFDHLNYLAE